MVTKVLTGYSQKITPKCFHTYRVNCLQEAKNWQEDRLTIKPQIFCYLKEIELKTMKIQGKTQQWVTYAIKIY